MAVLDDDFQQLQQVIALLKPAEKALIILHLEGYAHKEIAKMLGVSVGTSKSQLSKAKAMLKRMLEKTMTT